LPSAGIIAAVEVTSRRLADVPADVAARAQCRGFEHYFVPVSLDAASFTARIEADHVDAHASWIYETAGGPAGILLVARRGRTSRIAALGLAPELRGQGWGRKAMQQAIAQARERGDDRIVLEVISANEPAIALYAGLGFERRRRLVGWRHAAGDGEPADDALTEVAPSASAAWLQAWSDADLSWPLSPQSHAAAAPPLRGFALDDRATAIVDDRGPQVRVVSMAVRPDARRQGAGRRLVQALHEALDGRDLAVPAIVPEKSSRAFMDATGWELTPLSQYEMVLDLDGGGSRAAVRPPR
jgi:ribosomal protein S18 acetylase RimI-like enzyme